MQILDAPTEERTRCRICWRLIGVARLKRFPLAKLCERLTCTETHRKAKHARAQTRWRRKRDALDPKWKAERNAKAMERYWRLKPSSDTQVA